MALLQIRLLRLISEFPPQAVNTV